MIFNIVNGPSHKLPVLDSAFPRDVSTEVGAAVSFEVRIAQEGKPAEYTYQWYCDGAAIPGATGAAYSTAAEFGQHTLYCTVTGKAGTVISRTATLTADTLYLYRNGTVCPAAGGVKSDNGKNAFELRSDSLHINSTGHNVWGHVHFTNPIDLTKFKTLYVVGVFTTTGSGNSWGQIEFGAYATLGATAAAKLSGAKAQGTHTVDVSNLSGSHYISTYLKGFAAYAAANIQEVYLK